MLIRYRKAYGRGFRAGMMQQNGGDIPNPFKSRIESLAFSSGAMDGRRTSLRKWLEGERRKAERRAEGRPPVEMIEISKDIVQALVDAVECAVAIDLPHALGNHTLQQHGWSESDRYDLPASRFVHDKLQRALVEARGAGIKTRCNLHTKH